MFKIVSVIPTISNLRSIMAKIVSVIPTISILRSIMFKIVSTSSLCLGRDTIFR